MNSRVRLALALSTILGAAAFTGAANAQPKAQQSATAPAPAAGATTPTKPPPPPPPGRRLGPRRPGLGLFGRLGRLSPEDRTAVIDARLAAIRAGLELTQTQQPLWPPVEKAVKDGLSQAMALRSNFRKQGRPADPMQRLQRAAQLASAHASALQNFVNAAQPLYASLSPAQKARLPLLMRVARGIGAGPGRRPGPPWLERRGGRGEGAGPMERGPGPRAENESGRRENGGRDMDWRARMRQRMQEMNRDRREWRGPRLERRGDMDWGDGSSNRQDWRGDEN